MVFKNIFNLKNPENKVIIKTINNELIKNNIYNTNYILINKNILNNVNYYYFRIINNNLEKKDCLILHNYPINILFYMSYLIKKNNNLNKIDTCAIINAKSGNCSENCAFCSQSIYNNSEIPIYPLKTPEEILKNAKEVEKYSNRYSIVVSGKSINNSEFKNIIKAIKLIKKETKLKICVSLGLLTESQLKQLKQLNVRIHNNLETSKNYFKNICTTHSYEDKINIIKTAKKYNLDICCGGIIGIGESVNDRIELLYELKQLNVVGIPINIYNPIKGTKLYYLLKSGKIDKITKKDILKLIVLCRFIMPNKEIRLCGGREYNLENLQYLSLFAVNGIMVGNYLTTKGNIIEKDIKLINNYENKIYGDLK